jgi:hypothetical protein
MNTSRILMLLAVAGCVGSAIALGIALGNGYSVLSWTAGGFATGAVLAAVLVVSTFSNMD